MGMVPGHIRNSRETEHCLFLRSHLRSSTARVFSISPTLSHSLSPTLPTLSLSLQQLTQWVFLFPLSHLPICTESLQRAFLLLSPYPPWPSLSPSHLLKLINTPLLSSSIFNSSSLVTFPFLPVLFHPTSISSFFFRTSQCPLYTLLF